MLPVEPGRPAPSRQRYSGSVVEDKLADNVDGLLALGQEAREHLPDVDHFRPDFELDLNARGLRTIGDAVRVIEQGLGVADLDQQGRQAFQIGIERGKRCARILAL